MMSIVVSDYEDLESHFSLSKLFQIQFHRMCIVSAIML